MQCVPAIEMCRADRFHRLKVLRVLVLWRVLALGPVAGGHVEVVVGYGNSIGLRLKSSRCENGRLALLFEPQQSGSSTIHRATGRERRNDCLIETQRRRRPLGFTAITLAVKAPVVEDDGDAET